MPVSDERLHTPEAGFVLLPRRSPAAGRVEELAVRA